MYKRNEWLIINTNPSNSKLVKSFNCSAYMKYIDLRFVLLKATKRFGAPQTNVYDCNIVLPQIMLKVQPTKQHYTVKA